MRLERLFLILSILLSLTVFAMTIDRVHTAWEDVRMARGSLEAIERLQELLVVAEMASRERGPTNGLLGDDLPNDSFKQALLNTARKRTDVAFAKLQYAIKSSSMQRLLVTQTIEKSLRHLLLAREEVDRTSRLQRSNRSPEDIRNAISQMIGVIDDLRPAMIQLSTEAQTTYPSAANFLIVARKAVDLREYAGQLGSQFTAALAKRAPLTPQEQISIERLRGRIDLLNKQLVEQITANDNRVAVKTSIDTVQQRYFNSAIPFVEAQIAIGSINGHYNVDAAGFAARYVPDMDSIVTLRDVLMKEALEDARQSLDETRTAALWLASGNLLILALLGMTLWLINRRVVHPLSKATELILALAQGHLKITIPKSKHQDELAEVLNAIAVLRQNSEERVELEAERQRLVERLRELSNTDSLTGLLNRRCFFELAERVLPTLHRHGHPVTLAIFDIDHFKQVNDSYGHSVGDTVLVELAKLCRERCRSGDIVARFGGEEFVIMMPYCNIKEGAGQAERLRRYIEALRIPLPQGGELHISASFGVETCLPSDTSIHEVIKRADERLYVAKNTERNQVIWHDVPLD